MDQDKKRYNWLYCAPNVHRDPELAPKPSPELARWLIETFQRLLANAELENQVIEVHHEGLRPALVQFECFGESALIARWVDADTGHTTGPAVTLLMSGQDEQHDEDARKQLTQEVLLLSSDKHGATKLFFAKLGEEPRPLAATLCLSTAAYDDPTTRYLAGGLVRAFYG